MATLAPSRLLRAAFETPHPEDDADARQRLLHSYLHFKDRAVSLASEIHSDLPDFTVHDESHLDALWELADVVAGPDSSLNPASAYILGGAILLHDLGLAVASYPGGRDTLRTDPSWADTLVAVQKRQLGRHPTPAEQAAPDSEVLTLADQQVLRQRHAVHAQELAQIHWTVDGERLYLIEDVEIRTSYGPIIGELAHSHWWSTEILPKRFGQRLGPLGWCHSSWVVNPLQLACWLRVCDALHLDSRRAPLFLRAVRSPMGGLAVDHWKFQEHLSRPYLNGDRMEFTATYPFSADDANAWWLCYDTLASADQWIREVQGVLADSSLPALAVQGISGIDDPERLARLIKTKDWIPVDTRVSVSDVADLVMKLGGAELYGEERPHVALRELIQNSADAVRARRIHGGLPGNWGEIRVQLTTIDDSVWLEVRDTGVGMTPEVLSGALLDFGQSFWASSSVQREFPGLLAGGFDPTGKFGIGFFSVFMLTSQVTVISRPYRGAHADTHALEFKDGVHQRPILRQAKEEEYLHEGGTVVRAKLSAGLESLLPWHDDDRETLQDLCEWLAPSLDVTLVVVEDGETSTVAEAQDWIEMDAASLLARASQARQDRFANDAMVQVAIGNLTLIEDETRGVIGRAALVPQFYSYEEEIPLDGVVSVGGLRAGHLTGIAGILLGESATASRDTGVPFASGTTLATWATEQASMAARFELDPKVLCEIASVAAACGGDTGPLPICQAKNGWLNAGEFESWAANKESIVAVQDAAIGNDERENGPMELGENVVSVPMGYPGILQSDHRWRRGGSDWPMTPFVDADRYRGTIFGVVMQKVADSWGVGKTDVLDAAEISTDDKSYAARVGTRAEADVTNEHVDLLHRPPQVP